MLAHRLRRASPIVFIILFAVADTASAAQIESLTKAWIAVTDSETPPAVNDSIWQPVTLTDKWPGERYALGRTAWYRIPLSLPAKPGEPIGLLLRRTNMNASLYLNGEQILSGGSFQEPISRNWNRPLYAVPSMALWHEGPNDLYVRHISYPGYGYVSTLFMGPDRLLGPEYEKLYLLQVGMAQYLFPVVVALGLFSFSIWLRLRSEKIYLWFALAIGFWSVYIMNMFVKNLMISTKSWEWIAHFSVDAWVICFVLFMHTFVGDSLKVRGRLYAAFLLIAGTTYAVVDLSTLKEAVRYFHATSILIGAWVSLSMLWRWWHSGRDTTLGILNMSLIVLVGTGVHDWMFQSGMVSVTGPVSLHLHYYSAPFVFAFITWHLTGRFANTLKDLGALNQELESRIAAAETSLSERYRQIARMQRRQAILTERERLAREIHDGVGGNFTNAIMLTELISREAEPSKILSLKTQLQDGLTEVRQLITTMAGDLATVESLCRYVADKADAVLSAADIELVLDLEPVAGRRALSQSESLNLARIFQETVNNVLKHAAAQRVRFSCGTIDDRVFLAMEDDGSGSAAPSTGGYGLRNIRKRAAEIGAHCEVGFGARAESDVYSGIRVKVTLQPAATQSP